MEKHIEVDFDAQIEKWKNERKDTLTPEELEECMRTIRRIKNGDFVVVE